MNSTSYNFRETMAMIVAAITAFAPFPAIAADPPRPHGPLPSKGQLAYHKEELGAFIHYGMNTFTGKEWGDGKESPSQFTLDPASLDTDQWVNVIKDAGFKRIIFVAKHHDGFCNWFSGLTQHSVKYAEPANRVDILERLSKSCTAANLNMGVYLSPWDVNSLHYGMNDPSTTAIDPWRYNNYYMGQLKEILDPDIKKYGNNGHFVEVWMDGARGPGFYQPYFFDKDFLKDVILAKATGQGRFLNYPDNLDKIVLRDDQTWFGIIKGFNPDMVVFSPAGSELRWPATESGRLSMPLWSKVNPAIQRANYIANGESESVTATQYLATGDPNGTKWSIAEADTSILASGWFENNQSDPARNKQVKTMRQLGDIYFESVGRGGVLLLNFAPNIHGLLSNHQKARIKEFGDAIKNTFVKNLADGASAKASSYRADDARYAPSNVLDGNYNTYWTMDDDKTTGTITIDLGENKTFDVVSIQEYIPLGQRISRYKIEVYAEGAWRQYGQPSLQRTIGYKALVRGGTITASQVRLTVLESQAVPVINSVGLYKTASPDFEVSAAFAPEFVPDSQMKMIDDQSPIMKYTGNWRRQAIAGAFESTVSTTDRTGDNIAEAIFSGDSFCIVGMADPNSGKADVFINGTKAGTADFSGAQRAVGHLAFVSPPLKNGQHAVKIVPSEPGKAIGLDAIFYTDIKDTQFYYFKENAHTVAPGSSTIDFVVYRQGKTDVESSIQVSTAQDSAIAGRHYRHFDKIITFAPLETSKTISVQIISNETTTAGLDFYLRLDPVGNDKCYLNDNYSKVRIKIAGAKYLIPQTRNVNTIKNNSQGGEK